MTDPFYQNQQHVPQQTPQQAAVQLQQIQAQQVAQQKAQLQQQLNNLAQQEKSVRQQLQQLNTMWQNPQLTTEQRQQVQTQGTQLNQQLSNILKQKQQLTGQINKVIVKPKIKKGSKINMKGFLTGCGIFLVLLLGGAATVFYGFVQNPDKLSSMGLSLDTATQLLQAFVSIFFGLLVFTGFGLLIVNVYRLFTVKNKKKGGYIGGTLLGLIILIASASGWIGSLNKVKTISPDVGFNSQDLIISEVIMRNKGDLVGIDTNQITQMIAPANIIYRLNGVLFNSQVMNKLGSIDINKLSINLDCGNQKKLPLNLNNLKFEGSCLFIDKGTYQYTLEINYINPQTQEQIQDNINAGTITFHSAVTLSSNNEITFNDAKTEINLGKIPSKTTFDATSIFSDFGLSEYVISWDVDDDIDIDRKNDTEFTYIYKKAKVYNVTFRIPALNDLAYTFPVRLEPSDVPICEILSTELKGSNYNIDITFLENTEIITDYIHSIIDVQNNNSVIDTIKTTQNFFNYEFPGKGTYTIKTTFQTDEGKKGSCESDNIQIGSSDFNIDYSVKYKTPSDPTFKEFGTDDGANLVDDIVTIDEIPTILQININNITPRTATLKQKVFLDNKQILSLEEQSYEIPIEENKDFVVKIVAEDVNRDMLTETSFTVKVQRDDIIGKLIITPDTVGTDPFEVQFDASTTVINDSDDEIVYFTWDFGDGEIKSDVSQAIISHTYKYNYETENGTYNPFVVLRTKKGRELIIHPSNAIIVKKEIKTFTIIIDSHPGQVAKIGDAIRFSLELDNLPEKIFWDFGDGNTLECKERECIETTKIYNEAGTYKIKVKIIDDKSLISDSMITLKIE